MSNVTPIGANGVTPEVIASHLATDAEKIAEVYVIAFAKNGDVYKYFCGTASGMALAALVLQDQAILNAFARATT